jgi:hypothetical protein
MNAKNSESDEVISVDRCCLVSVAIVVLGILQFLFGILQAINAYPESFSIFDRFLSELGHDSPLTAESRSLFTRSTVLLGLSMFPFFYSIARAHVVILGATIYLLGMLLLPFLNQIEGFVFIRTAMITQKALVLASLLWLITVLRFIAIAALQQFRNHQYAAENLKRG